MAESSICGVNECDNGAHSRGWCKRHYMAWYRYGDPLGVAERAPKRSCSVEGCATDAFCRGWCKKHYRRWKAHGDPEGRALRAADIECSADQCATPSRALGLCDKHYQRRQVHGDANAVVLERTKNEGPCTVEGCDNPMRKRTWCAAHYAQWAREGRVRPFGYKWALTRGDCKSCGMSVPDSSATRRFCSPSCSRIYYASGGEVVALVECRRCGADIDRRPNGMRGWVREDVLMCKRCRHARTKGYGASASELAERDGTDCSLCGEAVDMSLTRADGTMCASVDHVIPFSLGGSDDALNLALAHLKCNQLKSNTIGWLAPA